MNKKRIIISGIRGLPASHGGFETFAEKLSLQLTANGWDVIVYCQKRGEKLSTISTWKNIKLINFYLEKDTSLATILFDLRVVIDSLKYKKHIILTLGYNTALFNIIYFLFSRNNIINMDGIEWKRNRWSYPIKIWFYFNEKFAKYFSTHMIADHPEIKRHLNSFGFFGKKITVIPYGADLINVKTNKNLLKYNLKKNRYAIVIARPVPENSILQIVISFKVKDRGIYILIHGNYKRDEFYQIQVLIYATENLSIA